MKLAMSALIVLIIGCSTFQGKTEHQKTSSKEVKREVISIDETIRPGDVKFLKLPKMADSKLFCRGQEQRISEGDDHSTAVVMESYFTEFKPFTCEFKIKDELATIYNFTVMERRFNEETLRVNPRTIKLSQKDQDRAWQEQLILNKIYASSHPSLFFKGPFVKPLKSKVTSIYGVRRVYNNEKKGQHLGTDFRAPIGEKVPATNRGKVVLARDLFYTGYTVIIDHGMDIFTVYGHLSKTLVKEGDIVEKKDLIGLSGNTGRSSGPHLHWGVKVQGQYVDGMILVDESKKFFMTAEK